MWGKKKYWNRNAVTSRCLSKTLEGIFVLRSILHRPCTWERAHQLFHLFSESSSSEVSQPGWFRYSQDNEVGISMLYFKEQKGRQSRGSSWLRASEPPLGDYSWRCLVRGSSLQHPPLGGHNLLSSSTCSWEWFKEKSKPWLDCNYLNCVLVGKCVYVWNKKD